MLTLQYEPRKSLRRLIIGGALSGVLFVSAAVPAFAAGNPSGTGQPNASCEDSPAVSHYDVACYHLTQHAG